VIVSRSGGQAHNYCVRVSRFYGKHKTLLHTQYNRNSALRTSTIRGVRGQIDGQSSTTLRNNAVCRSTDGQPKREVNGKSGETGRDTRKGHWADWPVA
jgi:hypothetical protein